MKHTHVRESENMAISSTPFDYFATTKTETYDKDNASSAANVYFRNEANQNYNDEKKWYQSAKKIYQTIGQNANDKANKKDNQTAASIMLDHYADKLEIPEGFNHSLILKEDLKGWGWWNIYEDTDLQDAYGSIDREAVMNNIMVDTMYQSYLKDNNGYDSFQEYFNSEQELGIKYSDYLVDAQGLAAIEYAQAEINLIENSFHKADYNSTVDGKLSVEELRSSSLDNGWASTYGENNAMTFFDLNKDHHVDATEYASFILTMDSNSDGILSQSEVEYANNNYENYTNADTAEYKALHHYYDELTYYLKNK